jgi:ectoine hydroxylase-related dioxygenase (phytanoyl-CoA dioxygenase family)
MALNGSGPISLDCCAYVPGRVVLFDGAIPHCILSANTVSPARRLSLAIQFIKKE